MKFKVRDVLRLDPVGHGEPDKRFVVLSVGHSVIDIGQLDDLRFYKLYHPQMATQLFVKVGSLATDQLGDSYEVVVRFKRYLDEDEDYALNRDPVLAIGLVKQVSAELQEACDNGLPGSYQIEAITLYNTDGRSGTFEVADNEDGEVRLTYVPEKSK